MRLFICVIIAATVIGGFVGGELMATTFSITGAVVGGAGLATILIGLGAYFNGQEKKRGPELTPEMRGVFDRIVGKPLGPLKVAPEEQHSAKTPVSPMQKLDDQVRFVTTVDQLITIQLLPKYQSPKEAFGAFMVNKRAAGYLFGFHDSLLQRLKLASEGNTKNGAELMSISYKRIFGEQAGYALYSTSVSSQQDPEFKEGLMSGGNDLIEYIDNKSPPLGLSLLLSFS